MTQVGDKKLLVPLDPTLPWDDAIRKGKYDGIFISPDFDHNVHLPPYWVKGGLMGVTLEIEVVLRARNETTTAAQWLTLLDDKEDNRDQFAYPRAVLAAGAEYQTEQRNGMYFAIWRDTQSQLWCLSLGELAGERILRIRRSRQGDLFDAESRAAVIAE